MLSPAIVNGVPENALKMPLICQSLMTAATRPRVVLGKRQLVDEAHLEDVRPVVAGEREVTMQLGWLTPDERRPAVLVRFVHRLAPGVGAFEQQAVLERAVDRHLQPVVAALRASGPIENVRGAGLREELPLRVAA